MTDRIDRAVYRAGVRRANGSTRRGFLARVGAAGAALGTGGMIAFPGNAHALCAGTTVTCNEYYGFNGCASNLCEDGSWCVGAGHCDNVYSGGTRWRDCCSNSCGCQTVAGKPSCCSGCIYGNSCSAANGWKVVCRYHSAC
ncbi:MAG TPA: twin-arginine translocation signal domain-containing protein [Solirubrobacteraceae bacterium]|nr:twin-arginine translocation signal domain-containing protein [Solirubrobacteraceae bacterium]